MRGGVRGRRTARGYLSPVCFLCPGYIFLTLSTTPELYPAYLFSGRKYIPARPEGAGSLAAGGEGRARGARNYIFPYLSGRGVLPEIKKGKSSMVSAARGGLPDSWGLPRPLSHSRASSRALTGFMSCDS